MSREFDLIFDQWKTFPGNYKPIRVWPKLAYKIIMNNCFSRALNRFIWIQVRYSISLEKRSILTWKLIFISRSCRELNFSRIYSLRNTGCFTVDMYHAFSNYTCFFFLICVNPMEDEEPPSLLNLGFITANPSYSVFMAPHIILKHCQSFQVHQSVWEYFRGIVRGTLPYGNIFMFPSQHSFRNARVLNHKQK